MSKEGDYAWRFEANLAYLMDKQVCRFCFVSEITFFFKKVNLPDNFEL